MFKNPFYILLKEKIFPLVKSDGTDFSWGMEFRDQTGADASGWTGYLFVQHLY